MKPEPKEMNKMNETFNERYTENQNPTDKTVQVVIAKTTKIQQANKICSALTQTCTSSLFLLHTCSCSDHMADDSG